MRSDIEVIVASEQTPVDPSYRISKLGRRPVWVAPDADIQKVATVMLANDFSQLPVMTNERDVKGIISWTTIATRLVLGKEGTSARHLMDSHYEVRADASIFQAIPLIVQHGYILVRGSNNCITGIVTASDLSLQFYQLAEPYFRLAEIENHIRQILKDKFSLEELGSAKDPTDSERNLAEPHDMTFGEYIRVLENNERWKKIKLPID